MLIDATGSTVFAPALVPIAVLACFVDSGQQVVVKAQNAMLSTEESIENTDQVLAISRV